MNCCNRYLPILLAGFCATGAFAQTYYNWTNTAGGSWQTAGNWNPSTVPAAGIVSRFNVPGSYTVTLNAPVAVDRLDAQTGGVHLTLDANGYTFDSLLDSSTTASEGLLFAYNGTSTITQEVTLTSSQPGGVIQVNRIRYGSGNRPAKVSMIGPNLWVKMDTALTSGDNQFNYSANGLTVMSNGVTVSGTRAFLFGTGTQTVNPNPLWLIADSGTMVSNSSASGIYLGKTSSAMPTALVTNGAIMSNPLGTFRVAQGGDSATSYNTNANARLIVTGAGSLVDSLYLGVSEFAGNGTLTRNGYSGTGGGFVIIENGGTLTNRGGVNISRAFNGATNTATAQNCFTNANAYGEIIIRGAGSALRGSGTMVIGRASQGAVYVLNGGLLKLLSTVNLELARTYYASGTLYPDYTNTNARGLLVVSNAGSYVECRALLVGGPWSADRAYGYGDVIVADGASLKTLSASEGTYLKPRSTLTISDASVETRNLSMNSNTTLRVELGARNHALPYLKLTAGLDLTYQDALGGRYLEIGVLDDFAAVANETIVLTEQASLTGSFENIAPGDIIEAGNYRFAFQQSATTLSLRVLPPRGTVMIAL